MHVFLKMLSLKYTVEKTEMNINSEDSLLQNITFLSFNNFKWWQFFKYLFSEGAP